MLSISLLASCGKKDKLVGEWDSQEKYGDKSSWIFKEDGSVIVIKDGKEQNILGTERKTSMKYSVDDSKNPKWFDIIINDDVNHEEVYRMKGIYDFLSDNTFKLCMPINKNDLPMRPLEFVSENTVIFERK